MHDKLQLFGFYCPDCKERFLWHRPDFRHVHEKTPRYVSTDEMLDTYVETGSLFPFPIDKTISLESFARFEVNRYEYENMPRIKEQLQHELYNHPIPVPSENN